MPDTDRVSIIRWRRTANEPPQAENEVLLGHYDGKPWTLVLVFFRDGWFHGEDCVDAPDLWAPLPSDQGLTVGDVLGVCEGADGSAAQHEHDAEHQGPRKAAHYRRIASEYSEAAKKPRAAVGE